MQGNPKVIDHLNKILRNELIAINQYFLHSKVAKSQGFTRLAETFYKESIEEMQHADLLIEHILELDGAPTMSGYSGLKIGTTIKAILEGDLAIEQKACPDLKEAIACCEQLQDYVTRDLLAKILISEEGHIDWLETQLQLIQTLGESNYLQAQL
jgi:bacterioferritin